MLCPLINDSCPGGYCVFYNKEKDKCCIPILADSIVKIQNITSSVTSSQNYNGKKQ